MEPISPSDFSDIVAVDDPDLDPSGEQVAFIRREPDGDESYESTVFSASLEDGSLTQLTVTEGNDSQPRFGPQGDRLAFVSDRLTDDDRPQLWILPLTGGEARQVTSVVGGVSSIEWSPDGSRILFTQQVTEDDREEERDLSVPDDYEPEQPDPRVIDRTIYRAHENYFDNRRELIYVAELDDDEVDRVTEWDDLDHRSPTWIDDNQIAFIRKTGEDPDDSLETEIVIYDVSTGEESILATIEGYVGGPDVSDSTLAIGVTPAPRPTLQQTNIELFDIETGDRRTLTSDLDRTVFGPVRFHPDGDSLYFATPDTGGYVLRRIDLASDDIEVVTDPDGAVGGVAVGEQTIAYVMSEWDHPGDLFVQTIDTEDHRRLTEINDDLLNERAVQQPEEHIFESPSGVDIQGWLLTPPNDVAEPPYPLVLEIHGGPHSMWTTSGTMWHEFQSLAGAGYAVLWTNPRGSVGYGESFAAAIERDWGDVTHEDLMAAVDDVVDRTDIDDEMFVTGGSFGGYQTAWTIGRSDRFTAAVSQRGVYDLPAFFGTADAYRLIESEFDTVPLDDVEFLYDRSPTSLVTEVDTPTLLIHSEDDFRTPIATAEMYYRALRKLEVPTRMVRYPREGHELSRSGEPGHRIDRIERIIRWFDGYASHTDVPPALERPPHEGLSMDDADEESD